MMKRIPFSFTGSSATEKFLNHNYAAKPNIAIRKIWSLLKNLFLYVLELVFYQYTAITMIIYNNKKWISFLFLFLFVYLLYRLPH